MNERFEYLRPTTVEEACELKARHGTASRFLAGGTDLIHDWRRGRASFDYCIDLTFIPGLDAFACDTERLSIGSLAKLATIAAGDGEPGLPGFLGSGASRMGTPQIRNIATVGGNICHASPCADMAVMLTALDGAAHLQSSRGDRTLPLREFFKGVNETGVADDELLTEVIVPVPAARTEASYQRAARTSVDLAQASAAVCLTTDDGATVGRARIVIGACAPVPVRSDAAEEMLVGLDLRDPDRETIELAAARAEWETSPICDIRGSDEYRREVSKVLVRRAVDDCRTRLVGVTAPV
jgi:CO/xanthine dehydrogenase FAD-binding subunit